jgi:hypothetical protein
MARTHATEEHVASAVTSRNNRRYVANCVFYMIHSEAISRDRPSGGGVEYFHRSPVSHRRRRKGKSRIWDTKIWWRVPRDSDPRMTALASPAAIVNDGAVLLSNRNKSLVVSPRWVFYSKTDWPTDCRS